MNNWGNSNWGYSNAIFGPQQKIVTVCGRQGAEVYRIGPDSNAILLDESGKIIWIVSTDGAGAKTIKPFDIFPHVDPEPPDYNIILQRMNKMEELINGLITATNNKGADTSAANTSAANTNVANTNVANTSAANTSAGVDLSKQF